MTAHYRHDPVIHDLDKHLREFDAAEADQSYREQKVKNIASDLLSGMRVAYWNGSFTTASFSDVIEYIYQDTIRTIEYDCKLQSICTPKEPWHYGYYAQQLKAKLEEFAEEYAETIVDAVIEYELRAES